MVLDDARNKVATEYHFTVEELRPRPSEIRGLVNRIRSKLSTPHAQLLTENALTMIFDSSDNSMRDFGNKAAHQASEADRVDSVLAATLTNSQRLLLRNIYLFAHGKEPDY